MPSPTDTPPASQAPRLAASIDARAAAGDDGVAGLGQRRADLARRGRTRASSGVRAGRAEHADRAAELGQRAEALDELRLDPQHPPRVGVHPVASGPRVSSSRWSVVLCSTWLRRSVTGPLCFSRGRASCGAGGGLARARSTRWPCCAGYRAGSGLVSQRLADRPQLGDLLGSSRSKTAARTAATCPGAAATQRVPAVVGEHREGAAPVGRVPVPAYPALLLQPGHRVREPARASDVVRRPARSSAACGPAPRRASRGPGSRRAACRRRAAAGGPAPRRPAAAAAQEGPPGALLLVVQPSGQSSVTDLPSGILELSSILR